VIPPDLEDRNNPDARKFRLPEKMKGLNMKDERINSYRNMKFTSMNLKRLFIVFWQIVMVIGFISLTSCQFGNQKKNIENNESKPLYEPTWNSVKNHTTPQWLKDGKFGIYTHWGVYAVPAKGPNGTWYSNKLYFDSTGPERKYQEATYGPLEKFGYKDFIPMFKAEKFNADEWADLFQKAGARFAGPVAEHHDGFAMWDTKYSEWNAAKMGPKRDVVGELAKAIKRRNMKFVTAFHHAEHWFFFPTYDKRYDCGDPKYSGLYGPIHEKDAMPDKPYLDEWAGKIKEVIDKYDPDFIWFDIGLRAINDFYKLDVLAYYYNYAVAHNKEVVVTYKRYDLAPGSALLDYENTQQDILTYYDWITDGTIDVGEGWGYVEGIKYRSVNSLIDNLVDRVSKNGYLLLNVGPKADGTIPDEVKTRLLAMGKWLQVNGEAIYGTTPWKTPGEGPTKPVIQAAMPAPGTIPAPSQRVVDANYFTGSERPELVYTGQDIRFTVKDNNLYAIVLDWPGDKVLITSLAPRDLIVWKTGLYTFVYPSEIASITMLGDGKELKWEMTKEGLSIETPKTKPCDYAYVFKIVRRNLIESP
jgi:alpha-L-fucosidase